MDVQFKKREKGQERKRATSRLYLLTLFYAARSICFIKQRKKKKKTPGRQVGRQVGYLYTHTYLQSSHLGLGRAVEQITNNRRARLVAGNALEDESALQTAERVQSSSCMCIHIENKRVRRVKDLGALSLTQLNSLSFTL